MASDSVDQYAEVVEEEDKFLRLLQILGDHADDQKKVIVFVGRQEQADSLFEQLTRCGYSSLSILPQEAAPARAMKMTLTVLPRMSSWPEM